MNVKLKIGGELIMAKKPNKLILGVAGTSLLAAGAALAQDQQPVNESQLQGGTIQLTQAVDATCTANVDGWKMDSSQLVPYTLDKIVDGPAGLRAKGATDADIAHIVDTYTSCGRGTKVLDSSGAIDEKNTVLFGPKVAGQTRDITIDVTRDTTIQQVPASTNVGVQNQVPMQPMQ